jgi:hypothetical protein
MMIREVAAHALPEPDFEQRGGQFATLVCRDWLTEQTIAKLDLNERQRNAIIYVKTNGVLPTPNIESWLQLFQRRRHATWMIWKERAYWNARVNAGGRTMSSNGNETLMGFLNENPAGEMRQ